MKRIPLGISSGWHPTLDLESADQVVELPKKEAKRLLRVYNDWRKARSNIKRRFGPTSVKRGRTERLITQLQAESIHIDYPFEKGGSYIVPYALVLEILRELAK